MNVHEIGLAIRRLGLTEFTYNAAILWSTLNNFSANRRFDRAHPELVAPPAALLFETGGTTSHAVYWTGGQERAGFIRGLLDTYLTEKTLRVCEWGCGVGRVIRHLSSTEGPRSVVAFGTDYNPRSIEWCKKHIPNVTFRANNLEPPLPIADSALDCIYSFSVFTHLPLDLQRRWLDDHLRVVGPGGIVMFTVHGDSYRSKLTPVEQVEYERTGIVVRAGVAEGRPWYTTYQEPAQVQRDLIGGLEIVHRELFTDTRQPAQDIWVVRKPSGV
jgi:SAM-dependent methyltransferase